jgi:hypothetical protein
MQASAQGPAEVVKRPAFRDGAIEPPVEVVPCAAEINKSIAVGPEDDGRLSLSGLRCACGGRVVPVSADEVENGEAAFVRRGSSEGMGEIKHLAAHRATPSPPSDSACQTLR